MCNPLTLLAIGGAVSAGVQIKGAIDAKKDRKRAAAEAKNAAEAEARAADNEARQSRRDEYGARRVGKGANPTAQAGSLFAPRSFFSPV